MTKSRIIFILRLLFSAVLLLVLWVWVDVDPKHLVPQNTTEIYWLIAAVVLMLVSIVSGSQRWQQVCIALGVEVSSARLLWHSLAGLFVSNFVPTTIGGDVLRVARLGKDIGSHARAFTTVTLERLSGWMVLPVCILVGLASDPSLHNLGNPTRVALLTAIITLVILAGIVLSAASPQASKFLGKSYLKWLETVHKGLVVLRERPSDVFKILGSGFIYQLILISSFWCAAKSVGIETLGIRATLAYMPAVLILQVLPLGVGGLGVREWALILFLGSVGVAKDQAVALGLTIYAITLVSSLIGAPALAFGTKTGSDDDDSTGEKLPESVASPNPAH